MKNVKKRQTEVHGGPLFGLLLKRILMVVVVLLAVLAIAFKIYALNYYHADEDTIAEIEAAGDVDITVYGKDTLVFTPKSDENVTSCVVFYPGGKVEYKAYEGLMYKLAEHEIVGILPRMPENLAFLAINAADGITDAIPDVSNWYLAGHSLGGVAAAEYLKEDLEADGSSNYDGIILCASYTTADFSDADIRLLSMYGTNDGVLNMESYTKNKVNWPKDATQELIDGGIHSYFGCYGIQSGDGTPAISNEEELEKAAEQISEWITQK